MSSSPSICAPVVVGSGVMVVHRALESAIADYRIRPLSPWWGLFPPALALAGRLSAGITHSLPELGAWAAASDSELVATFHNYYLDAPHLSSASWAQRSFYRGMLSPMVRSSVKRARWITAVSRYTADLVRQHHPVGDRLVVVHNGVDTSLFSPGPRADSDVVRILFAGNPIRRKGIDHLHALAEQLPPNVQILYTVGLRDSALTHPGASDRLVPVARREHDQMADLYRSVDILFFPTRREGFGLVVAEAMACGLPIVATNGSAIPELVDHGRGGLLFEPDHRQQMLDSLLVLARDPALRAQMGAYNRERAVVHFGLQRMLDGYREIFAACSSSA